MPAPLHAGLRHTCRQFHRPGNALSQLGRPGASGPRTPNAGAGRTIRRRRGAPMTTEPRPGPIPPGTPVLTPWAASKDTAALIVFLEQAFGAREQPGRIAGEDGRVAHAQVEIGDALLLLFDADPAWP